MGFASAYLAKRAIFTEFINEAPDSDTGLIVVVPSYDEPGITLMLDSLSMCYEPDCKTEVIIVVNAPANATTESCENNRETILNIETWKTNHPVCFSRIYVINATSFRLEGWGVGLARKTGMDEAMRRFDRSGRPEGIIVSLDADCTVEKNYFTAICDEFLKRKDRSACSIYFEHPLTGNDFNDFTYQSILLYELHLRCYFQGLSFAGFPYCHHTVGSAFALKAISYVKSGGMNTKMAGEDFYFIQKLIAAGGFFNLSKTTVFPSARSSFRVPFGTGAAVGKMVSEKNEILTYNIQAFKDLKSLFSMIDRIYLSDQRDLEKLYSELPQSLGMFLTMEEWISKIMEIKCNTKGIQSFRKRFFGWFNMFRIVRYMNSAHKELLPKKPVIESASELLCLIGDNSDSKDASRILNHFRTLEKRR